MGLNLDYEYKVTIFDDILTRRYVMLDINPRPETLISPVPHEEEGWRHYSLTDFTALIANSIKTPMSWSKSLSPAPSCWSTD